MRRLRLLIAGALLAGTALLGIQPAHSSPCSPNYFWILGRGPIEVCVPQP